MTIKPDENILILLEWQNYLRTQAGNTTTVNVVICTVDYLLRLQESIMDFYWHYSSKELIDPAGKANFFKAIGVASQVFNTLTEVIQGPCTLNQQALAHSRYILVFFLIFFWINTVHIFSKILDCGMLLVDSYFYFHICKINFLNTLVK